MIATSAHNSVINQAEDRLCRERLGLFIADDGYRCRRPVMPVRSVGGRMPIARLRLKQCGQATLERALCGSNATMRCGFRPSSHCRIAECDATAISFATDARARLCALTRAS